jgi:hypothetical protein
VNAVLQRIAIREPFLDRYVLVFPIWPFKQQKAQDSVVEREEEKGKTACRAIAAW